METKYVITVGQLRSWLVDKADDMPIVMSKDGEGNGFSPLASGGLEVAWYNEITTWSGEVYSTNVGSDLTQVICLWPVN
jgi:hypothetical protein